MVHSSVRNRYGQGVGVISGGHEVVLPCGYRAVERHACGDGRAFACGRLIADETERALSRRTRSVPKDDRAARICVDVVIHQGILTGALHDS